MKKGDRVLLIGDRRDGKLIAALDEVSSKRSGTIHLKVAKNADFDELTGEESDASRVKNGTGGSEKRRIVVIPPGFEIHSRLGLGARLEIDERLLAAIEGKGTEG